MSTIPEAQVPLEERYGIVMIAGDVMCSKGGSLKPGNTSHF